MRWVVWVCGALAACGSQSASKKIESWGQGWYHAKRCMFGEKASYRNPKAALLQRQLADPRGYSAMVDCIEKVAPLAEATAPERALEQPWTRMVDTVPRIVSELEGYRKGSGEDRGKRRARLAALILAVDGHYAAVRQAAGMSPPPRPKATAAEVAAAPKGLVFQARGGGRLTPRVIVREGNSITVQGTTDTGSVIAVARGPDAIERYGLAPGVTRAMNGAAWGVFKDKDGSLRAGAIDDNGDPTTKGSVVARFAVRGFKKTFKLEPILAAGRGKWRAVVYDRYFSIGVREMWLSVSKNGGTTWPRGIRIRYARNQEINVTASWAMGHAHITWDAGGKLHWLPISENTLSNLILDRVLRRASRASNYHDSSCLADNYLWWISENSVMRAQHGGKSGSQIISWSMPDRFGGKVRALTHCDDTNIVRLFKRGAEARVLHCPITGCNKPIEIPDVGEQPRVAFEGDRVVVGNVVDDHLVLWRPKSGPVDPDESPITAQVAYRLAPETRLAALVVWGRRLHAVLRGGDHVRAVSVPLPK